MDDRIYFSDTDAEKLHDKTAYKILSSEGELHDIVVWALMESLDDDDLMQIREAVDDSRVRWYTDRIKKWRKEHAREAAAQDPVNFNARGLLKDRRGPPAAPPPFCRSGPRPAGGGCQSLSPPALQDGPGVHVQEADFRHLLG